MHQPPIMIFSIMMKMYGPIVSFENLSKIENPISLITDKNFYYQHHLTKLLPLHCKSLCKNFTLLYFMKYRDYFRIKPELTLSSNCLNVRVPEWLEHHEKRHFSSRSGSVEKLKIDYAKKCFVNVQNILGISAKVGISPV